MGKYWGWVIIFLLAIWVILLRIPSLDEPLDNDSGAVAYHARLILHGEPLYSTHHTGHHMPGAFYTYALAFMLFGDQQFAPKMLLLPWTILVCWVLYYLGRKVSGEGTGVIAAVFFALISSQVMLKGMTGEPELFANLPITFAIALIILLLIKKSSSWLWLWVGVLSALAVIYKVVNLAPLATAGITILADFWEKHHMPGESRKFLERMIWLGIGFAIPILGMVAYFAQHGLLSRFLLIFSLGLKYVQEFSDLVQPLPLPPLIGFPIFLMSFNNIVLLVIGLVAALRMFRNKVKLSPPDLAIRVALISWLLLSFVEAGINRVGLAHYVLLIVPALSFFAALEINGIYLQMREQSSQKKARILAGGMLSLVLLNSVITNRSIYVHEAAYRLGKETYEQSLAERPGAGEFYLKIKPVAEYIRSHTAPEDLVYYWGTDAQFYYLAERRCALEFIWPYYATSSKNLENIFASQTKYIILASVEEQPRPIWLINGMSKDYHYETSIQGIEIYQREGLNDSP